jgi:hypothetical protein
MMSETPYIVFDPESSSGYINASNTGLEAMMYSVLQSGPQKNIRIIAQMCRYIRYTLMVTTLCHLIQGRTLSV